MRRPFYVVMMGEIGTVMTLNSDLQVEDLLETIGRFVEHQIDNRIFNDDLKRQICNLLMMIRSTLFSCDDFDRLKTDRRKTIDEPSW